MARRPAEVRDGEVVRRLQRLWSGHVTVSRGPVPPAMVLVVVTDDPGVLEELRAACTAPCLWVAHDGRARRKGGIPAGCDYVMEPEELRGSKGALALRYLVELGSRRLLEQRLTTLRPLAQAGHAAAALGHEAATALSVMMTTLDDLRLDLAQAKASGDDVAPATLLESVVDAHVAARQLARMISDLSTVVRSDGSVRTLAVGDVVRAAARMEAVALSEVEVVIPRGVEHVRADEARLYQVFMNLLRNAAQALQGRRAPRIEVRQERVGEWVEVHVLDNGPGLPAGAEEEVFRPWFTTRRDGTGLGLALCRDWVGQMGGELVARPCIGGAHFVLRLRAAQHATADMPTLVPAVPNGVTLMIVEDADLLRRAMRRALSAIGTVHGVASAEEALERLDGGLVVDVLLTDVRLGGMSGRELVARVRADHADRVRQVIVVSGDTSMAVKEWTEALDIPWARKPIGAGGLRDLVQQQLARVARMD